MHEEFGTPDGVYYLLADPRLAEAHDYGTVVPLTGADRSTPKPLTGSNLLHSLHQGDEQYKNVRNEPLDQYRWSVPNSPRCSKILMSWLTSNLCCFRVLVFTPRDYSRQTREWRPSQDG